MRLIHAYQLIGAAALLALRSAAGVAGEKEVAALSDMSTQEIRAAGFELKGPAILHIKALGAGGDYGWTYRSDRLSAYG
jgi:hypothetical protein